MALLFTLPRVSTIDLVGEVAGAATLEFYQTLTSTPQPVYADFALDSSLGSTVTASDAGLFRAIYLDDTLPNYKIIAKDSSGVEIWSVDPYISGPTQSQIGQALYPRTNAERSADITPTNYSYPERHVDRYGTNAFPGSTDMTVAIQSAINVSQEYSPGSSVYFGSSTYRVISQLTVSNSRIHLLGQGWYATRILYAPIANGICLKIENSSTITQGSVRDIGFWSDDGTYTKTAIDITDMSGYVLHNIAIGGSVAVGSTGFWSGGTGSIGIRTRGRDSSVFDTLNIACDKPLVISPNPHLGFPLTQISADHFNFHNFYALANANPIITVESGSVLTQVSFTGYQAWVLGTGGLYWVDATSPGSSQGLIFDNVRYENCEDATKYAFHIDLQSPLQGWNVRSGQTAGCRGFYLRGINRTHIDTFAYTDATREAMNANATVSEIKLSNAFWQTGSTATLTGLKIMNQETKTTTGPLPCNGLIASTTGVSDVEFAAATIGGEGTSVAVDGTMVIGAIAQQGLVVICDETTQGPALYMLNGANQSVAEVSDPGSFYSITKDAASTYNVYWEATALSGVGAYVIQNKRALTAVFRVMRLGRA